MFLRSCLLGFAAFAAVMASFGAGPALAQEVTLKLHHFLPPQANVPALVLDVWADNVEAQSEGRIKVDRYPAMQLGGKPPELMDQAMDGVADIIWTVVGYTPGRYPRAEVVELPFMMKDAESMSRVFWELFERHMRDTEFRHVKILGTWVHGPGVLHTEKPVATPEDLRGLKVRGASRQVNALLARIGATPIGLPVPSVPEALSKGVISGAALPWEVTTALKVPEMVNNHTEFEGGALYTLAFVLAMNKEKYESLPDDLKAVIDANSGLEFSAFAGRVMQESDGPARAFAISLGNNVITVPATEVARWEALARPVYDDWIADMEAKGIDGRALLEDARALIVKHQPPAQ